MRQNKYSKMSEEEKLKLAAQYLKEDQEAFDLVQKARTERQERMENLQRLADDYQQVVKSGGRAAAKEMLKKSLQQAKKNRQTETEESPKVEAKESRRE